MHVFKYSPRPGTRASSFPDQVQEKVKDKRMQDMLRLKHQSRKRFLRQQVGKHARVLVEKNREGNSFGHTENFLWAEILGENLPKNELVDVIISDVHGHTLSCSRR